MRGVYVQQPYQTTYMTPVHLTNELRTITGDIQDKTGMHGTTNGYSCSLPSVSIFVHAQNFPTDADGQTAHQRT